MVKKDNNTPNICTAEYTMFEVNGKRPGKMGAIHKITHFVELVEHRTKVKVGFDEKMLSGFPKYLFFSYHGTSKLISSERVNCTCQAGLGLDI